MYQQLLDVSLARKNAEQQSTAAATCVNHASKLANNVISADDIDKSVYDDLCVVIDGYAKILGAVDSNTGLTHKVVVTPPNASSRVSTSSSTTTTCNWLTMMTRPLYRAKATALVNTVDWTWITQLPAGQQQFLPLYQLFLLCKLVAEDFDPVPETNRLQFSPTPAIDVLWHAHLQRPRMYIAMHQSLGYEVTKGGNLLDHQPEASEDSWSEKVGRLRSLQEYCVFLCPCLMGETVKESKPQVAAVAAATVATNITTATVSTSASKSHPREEKGDMPVEKKARVEQTVARSHNDSDRIAREEFLTVQVRMAEGTITFFKLKQDTKFIKVYEAMACRLGLSVQSIRFALDGEKVQQDDTPLKLELQDMDCLTCSIDQIGC